MADRNNFFKISNLVSGRKEIVTRLYSSLEGNEERDTLGRVFLPFVKINGLGKFLEESKFSTLTVLCVLNLAVVDSIV
jgi:hypothetical protein